LTKSAKILFYYIFILSENKTTNETKISIKKSVESLVLSEGHISGKIAFSSTWSAL